MLTRAGALVRILARAGVVGHGPRHLQSLRTAVLRTPSATARKAHRSHGAMGLLPRIRLRWKHRSRVILRFLVPREGWWSHRHFGIPRAEVKERPGLAITKWKQVLWVWHISFN